MEKPIEFNKSFNAEFCQELEYAISKAFKSSADSEIANFWCDGVLQAPFYNDSANIEYLKIENVLKRKTIQTISWVGLGGQTVYNTTIKLGKLSLELYSSGQHLSDAIPSETNDEWFIIDQENKELNIHLL